MRADSEDTTRAAVDQVRERVGQVPDPEIPVVTLSDLGILRDVRADDDGRLVVTLTPTYSGCPATEMIATDVRTVLTSLGHADARVEITLSPAWTTDWITAEARDKLRKYGIAPPPGNASVSNAHQTAVMKFVPRADIAEDIAPDTPACPRCASDQTEKLSEFGSTPCQAQYRCLSCREPFDYFKPY